MAARGESNRMPKSREGSVLSILRKNTITLFNLLNLVLALLLLLVGGYRNMLFMGVVLSNTLIGIIQELRAKQMHDRLELLAEGTVRTLRDGRETAVPFGELVRGDVVLLARGDQVPADAEILEGLCGADESLLTGESEAIAKNAGQGLRSGSFLTEGAVTARLTAVGANSYAGRLQMAARKVKRSRSELMEDMQKIIRRVSIAIVPMGILLFWRHMAVHQVGLAESVIKTVAAVLGMIPEGLVLLTSVALTVGVLRLGQRKALVNELYGIESLARTDVVCVDKTGTLTSGEMALAEVRPLGQASQEAVSACMAALLSTQQDAGPTRDALLKEFPGEANPWGTESENIVPFSSGRKWSAAQFVAPGLQTLVLGAPERVLAEDAPERALAKEWAGRGMRVLALSQTVAPLEGNSLPKGLRPLALLCLRDVLRPEVCETVRYFEEQGVTLKIISGDNPLTVANVAAAAGVALAERSIDLSACEAPVNYAELCEAYTVFGRVSPEDKRELIMALKARGHSVAMVGDGVNDIPALKASDCSIALGGGSSAACRVAQITLLDQNFAIMPEIVLEGRRVINNITRASSLFLVKNIFSFLLAVSLLALPFVYPFAPIQLTLISTLTVGIPSFALALQPSRERVRGNFLRNVFLFALPGGVTVWATILVFCAAGASMNLSHGEVSTLCTVFTAYAGIWVLLGACRPWNALRLSLVAAMATLLTVAICFFAPVFYLEPSTVTAAWALAAGACITTPLFLWGCAALIRRL